MKWFAAYLPVALAGLMYSACAYSLGESQGYIDGMLFCTGAVCSGALAGHTMRADACTDEFAQRAIGFYEQRMAATPTD